MKKKTRENDCNICTLYCCNVYNVSQVILYYIIFMKGFPLRELSCHFVNKMHLISKQLYIYKKTTNI